jgi:hypothetical protein
MISTMVRLRDATVCDFRNWGRFSGAPIYAPAMAAPVVQSAARFDD